VLSGGFGQDIFVFDGGIDRIKDWRNGEQIWLDASALSLAGQTATSVVSGAAVTGGSVVLNFGADKRLIIEGLTNTALLVDDIVFV
jgi:serralysin